MHVRIGRLVLLLFCVPCLLAKAEDRPSPPNAPNAPNAPTTKPGEARGIEAGRDPQVEAGRLKAEQDVAAGILGESFAVPEMFLMQWMMPGSEDKDLMEYYQAIVADRYAVKSDWVMYHAASPQGRARADGYNQVMGPLVEKKFGAGVLDKAWKEACGTPPEKRAAYLKARKDAAGQPLHTTTRSSTQSSTRPSDAAPELNK